MYYIKDLVSLPGSYSPVIFMTKLYNHRALLPMASPILIKNFYFSFLSVQRLKWNDGSESYLQYSFALNFKLCCYNGYNNTVTFRIPIFQFLNYFQFCRSLYETCNTACTSLILSFWAPYTVQTKSHLHRLIHIDLLITEPSWYSLHDCLFTLENCFCSKQYVKVQIKLQEKYSNLPAQQILAFHRGKILKKAHKQ